MKKKPTINSACALKCEWWYNHLQSGCTLPVFFICSFIIQEKKKEKMEKRSAFRKCFFFIWLLNMQEV